MAHDSLTRGMAHADFPAPGTARRTLPLRRGLLGRGSCLARTISGSRRSSGNSGSICRRLAAPAARRCLVIRIRDILSSFRVRVVSILTVKGRGAMTRCRHGQHPPRRPAGCHRGMPASRNSNLLKRRAPVTEGPALTGAGPSFCCGAIWRSGLSGADALLDALAEFLVHVPEVPEGALEDG